MIVVTGATGHLGSQIVDHLLERLPAEDIGVSVRDPDRASALADRGVRVRAGDFRDPATLAHVFEGADQVLVVSAAIVGDQAITANRAAIDAARAAGAQRVLYTSHQAAAADSLFAAQPVHAATEQYLTSLSTPFTALRNGFYASTLEFYVPSALQTGTLFLPEDGPVSWTSRADLAEAAAITLTKDGVLDGITPPLTAPEMLDFADVARILSDLTGRAITRVVVGDDEWVSAAIERGMPAGAATFSLGLFQAARRGEFAVTDPALEDLLGRPATPARAVLQQLAGV